MSLIFDLVWTEESGCHISGLMCRVFIGNVFNADKEDLESFFMKFGPVRSVWVARRPPGFAYVQFEKEEDAELAIREGNNGMIGNERIRVELARSTVGMSFAINLKKDRSDRRRSRSRSHSQYERRRGSSRSRDRHSRRVSRSRSRSHHHHDKHSRYDPRDNRYESSDSRRDSRDNRRDSRYDYHDSRYDRHDSRAYHRDSRRDRSDSSRRSRR